MPRSTLTGLADEGDLPPEIAERLHAFVGRQWAFEAVAQWHAGEGRSFLLTGPPGSGKSRIAARLAEHSNCAYSHFCRAWDPSSNPITFVERLSEALDACLPGYRDVLMQRAARNVIVSGQASAGIVEAGGSVIGASVHLHIYDLSPEAAFDETVRKPLEMLGDGAPLVVVVDGLDEALTAGSRNLVELMNYVVRSSPPRLRFILTSRSGEVRVFDRLGPGPAWEALAASLGTEPHQRITIRIWIRR